MADIARLVVLVGIALVVPGLVLWLLSRAGFRGLPGDIRIEGESF